MKQLSYGFKDKNGLLAALDKLQQEMPKNPFQTEPIW